MKCFLAESRRRTLTPVVQRILSALLSTALLSALSLPAQAETYYFDNNAATAGFGSAGGTWVAPTPGPTPGWSTNSTGSTSPGSVSTTTGDALNFGSGTNGLGGGTITISGTVDSGAMTFAPASGAITLSTGTINLGPAVTITVSNAADTISAVLAGAATSVTKSGTGTLTLSGVNTFAGQLNIENGTVYNNTGLNNKSVSGTLGAGTLVVLGASGQTGRLAILVDGGVSTTKDFTLAAGGNGEIQFGNLGTFNVTNADRPLTISGNIGGSGNLVKLGFAAVVLSGTNTYSGTTTVSQGPLRLSSANALPGGIGATGGTSALTINGTNAAGNGAILELASGNFLRGLGTGVDQFQMPGGYSGFGAKGGARQVIVNNDPSFELVWGIPTFNPTVLHLNYQATSDNTLTLQNKIDLNGSTRTINVFSQTAVISGDIRTGSGTAGITKTGAGTLILSGTNTYNGPTTVSAGTLTLSSSAAVGGTSQIILSGTSRLEINAASTSLARLAAGSGVPLGTFLKYSQTQSAAGTTNGPGLIRGTVEINLTNVNPDYTLDLGSDSVFLNLVAATYTSPITLSGNASINSSTAAFTLGTGGITASTAGTKTLTITGSNTGANSIGGVIGNGSGTVALVKSSTGAWTLSAANTYSGTTTVNGGTLTLSSSSGSILNSAVTVAGGTMTITNAASANSGNRLSDSAALTMNGGTFNFNNDASANDFSESAGTLTLIGGANTLGIQQAAAGQASTLTFAGLSRTAGAIDFSGAGLSNAVNPRSKITFTSPPPLTDGIIGPWATVNGSNYATIDASSNVVAYGGTMTDVTRKDSGTKVIPDSSTADVRIVEGTGTLGNLTLAASTTTINTLMQSISGGTSPATVNIGNGTNLLVNSVNQVATVGSLFIGASSSDGTIKPAAAGGNLLLINNSTANNNANSNNNMIVHSVVADNTSASTVTKDGSGVLRLTATNTYSGGTVINAGTMAVRINANLGATGSGVTFNGQGVLSCGNHPATGALTVDLGTRPIAINNGVIAGLYHNWADTTITIGGAVTGNGGLTWGRDPVLDYSGGSGSVVLNLNSTSNTFTGPITAGMGTENAQGGNSQFNFSSLADSANAMTFNLGGTVYFSYNATGPTANLSLASRPINLLNSNTTFRNQNATYTLTLGPVSTTTSGAKTLNLGPSGAGATIAGAITDGIGQIGVAKSSGTWVFSGTNTYTGVTTLNNDSGQLTVLGKAALSPYTTVAAGRSTTLSLRMDDAGTVNLGNNVQPAGFDTSSTLNNYLTVDVRNNGGATTNSTLVLGKVDFVSNPGNNACGRGIRATGANGYRLQFGNVDLSWAVAGTASGGPQRFEPQTAPITIAGTVRQVTGNTGASSTDNNLYLGGTTSNNLISGSIHDAADYPSNPAATPLNLYKGESGEWILSGTNSYSGSTTVNAGTLVISGGSASRCLPDGANLTINGTGVLRLNTGVKESVGSLTLGSTPQSIGSYGSSLSGADYTNNVYFAGSGRLYVGVPIPAAGTVLKIK